MCKLGVSLQSVPRNWVSASCPVFLCGFVLCLVLGTTKQSHHFGFSLILRQSLLSLVEISQLFSLGSPLPGWNSHVSLCVFPSAGFQIGNQIVLWEVARGWPHLQVRLQNSIKKQNCKNILDYKTSQPQEIPREVKWE